jgi:hypothetical protein
MSAGRDGFIPPYQDLATLAEHLTLGESTIENWVKLGKLPPPVTREGKRLWRWKDVERYLARGDSIGTLSDEAQRIREATRRAAARSH